MARIVTLEAHPERCGLAAEAADLGVEVRQLAFGRRPGKASVAVPDSGADGIYPAGLAQRARRCLARRRVMLRLSAADLWRVFGLFVFLPARL